MNKQQIQDIEINLLLDGIQQVYGYDFREYAEASLNRRLTSWLGKSGFSNFSDAQGNVLRNHAQFEKMLCEITVNVTEMFRDPPFFKAIREKVIPLLKTYPFIKIWHAGCATGEEAYSMAIILQEEGLAGRYRMYATDINAEVLNKAKDGIYSLQDMQKYTRNYQQSGGKSSFSDYYTARYDRAILEPKLKEQIVFAEHNLAVDGDFGEMHLILCRNVLIYFKQPLKERIYTLFDSCLAPGGYLCLGTKETLEGRAISHRYNEIANRLRIYQKRYV